MIVGCPAEPPPALADVLGYPKEVDEVVSRLTPRRWESAALIAVGLSNVDLAHWVVITDGTVVNQVAAILDKVGHRAERG